MELSVKYADPYIWVVDPQDLLLEVVPLVVRAKEENKIIYVLFTTAKQALDVADHWVNRFPGLQDWCTILCTQGVPIGAIEEVKNAAIRNYYWEAFELERCFAPPGAVFEVLNG